MSLYLNLSTARPPPLIHLTVKTVSFLSDFTVTSTGEVGDLSEERKERKEKKRKKKRKRKRERVREKEGKRERERKSEGEGEKE